MRIEHQKVVWRVLVLGVLLADLFYRMDKIERAGTGIRRMKSKLHDAGLLEPLFEFDSFFFITLKRPIVKDLEKGVSLTKNQQRILLEIQKNNSITQQELSAIIGITQKNIRNNINKLKGKGLLQRIGPDKGGHWEIIKK